MAMNIEKSVVEAIGRIFPDAAEVTCGGPWGTVRVWRPGGREVYCWDAPAAPEYWALVEATVAGQTPLTWASIDAPMCAAHGQYKLSRKDGCTLRHDEESGRMYWGWGDELREWFDCAPPAEPVPFVVPVGGHYWAAVQERGCNTFGVVEVTRVSELYYACNPVGDHTHLLPRGEDGPAFAPPYADDAGPTKADADHLATRLSGAACTAWRDALNTRQMSAGGVRSAAACAAMDVRRWWRAVPGGAG